MIEPPEPIYVNDCCLLLAVNRYRQLASVPAATSVHDKQIGQEEAPTSRHATSAALHGTKPYLTKIRLVRRIHSARLAGSVVNPAQGHRRVRQFRVRCILLRPPQIFLQRADEPLVAIFYSGANEGGCPA